MGWPEMQIAIERLADAMTKDQREQRRYEIARDVMAARAAAYALAFRFERSSEFKANAAEAVEAADALLAALEEE